MPPHSSYNVTESVWWKFLQFPWFSSFSGVGVEKRGRLVWGERKTRKRHPPKEVKMRFYWFFPINLNPIFIIFCTFFKFKNISKFWFEKKRENSIFGKWKSENFLLVIRRKWERGEGGERGFGMKSEKLFKGKTKENWISKCQKMCWEDLGNFSVFEFAYF